MLKIAISSTCYDWGEHRNNIKEKLKLLGHEVILSDQGDILYDPNISTHKSCIEAIKNCDLIIFLIGNRFGGTAIPEVTKEIDYETLEKSNNFYSTDKKLSITQCEVLTAIQNNIPVYPFILDTLIPTHHIYEKNKKKQLPHDFEFPGVGSVKEAKYIFEFFNYIRKDRPGNFYFEFKTSTDVCETIKNQLNQLFKKLLTESRVKKKNENHVIADVVNSISSERENYFDEIFRKVEKERDIVRVMGTGVTSFLSRKDRIGSLLRNGNNIELLLINNQIIKGNFQCSSDEFINKIITEQPFNTNNEYKVFCPLHNTKFLIDTKHFNKYHKRDKERNYHERVQKSIETILEYQEEFKKEGFKGTITAKHFNSFVPLSITALYDESVYDNELIAEFILPFSENRIIFNSTKKDNPKVYKIFMDFFKSTWKESTEIKNT